MFRVENIIYPHIHFDEHFLGSALFQNAFQHSEKRKISISDYSLRSDRINLRRTTKQHTRDIGDQRGGIIVSVGWVNKNSQIKKHHRLQRGLTPSPTVEKVWAGSYILKAELGRARTTAHVDTAHWKRTTNWTTECRKSFSVLSANIRFNFEQCLASVDTSAGSIIYLPWANGKKSQTS